MNRKELLGEWTVLLEDPLRNRAERLWEEYYRDTDAEDLRLGARDRDGRPDGSGIVPPWNRAASNAFACKAYRRLIDASRSLGIPDEILREAADTVMDLRERLKYYREGWT